VNIVIVILLSALVIHGVIENVLTLRKWARLCRDSPCSRSYTWFFAASLIDGTLQICCGTAGLALFVFAELFLSRLVPFDIAALIASVPLWAGLGIGGLKMICFPEQPFWLAKGGRSISRGPVFPWTVRAISLCFVIVCIAYVYLMLTTLIQVSQLCCSPATLSS
jgi:hypothetical protein